MNSVEQKIEKLNNRMYKLLCNKPYSANRNHVNKIAEQLRYLERFLTPKENKNGTEI